MARKKGAENHAGRGGLFGCAGCNGKKKILWINPVTFREAWINCPLCKGTGEYTFKGKAFINANKKQQQ